MMFTAKKIIRDRVMQAVEAHIDKVQSSYDDKVREMEEKLEKDKADLAETMVQKILSKLL